MAKKIRHYAHNLVADSRVPFSDSCLFLIFQRETCAYIFLLTLIQFFYRFRYGKHEVIPSSIGLWFCSLGTMRRKGWPKYCALQLQVVLILWIFEFLDFANFFGCRSNLFLFSYLLFEIFNPLYRVGCKKRAWDSFHNFEFEFEAHFL